MLPTPFRASCQWAAGAPVPLSSDSADSFYQHHRYSSRSKVDTVINASIDREQCLRAWALLRDVISLHESPESRLAVTAAAAALEEDSRVALPRWLVSLFHSNSPGSQGWLIVCLSSCLVGPDTSWATSRRGSHPGSSLRGTRCGGTSQTLYPAWPALASL